MPFRVWNWLVSLRIIQSECSYYFAWGRTKECFPSKKRGISSLSGHYLTIILKEEYETMLSCFYGVKMGYLIADKRSNDALEIGRNVKSCLTR